MSSDKAYSLTEDELTQVVGGVFLSDDETPCGERVELDSHDLCKFSLNGQCRHPEIGCEWRR